jgi:ubiquitin C-terminal hydrolase
MSSSNIDNINQNIIENINKVGLKNRGNTCYLNTAIQCMYHIKELTDYFIKKEYLDDLKYRFNFLKKNNQNIDEILFTKEFGKLINAMYISNTSIEPKSFHEIIQKQDDRFSGYEQQDSQEALSLILDKLHDGLKYSADINYVGNIENDIDKHVVDSIKNWKQNLNEYYSIIANLFFGQYIIKIISLEPDEKNKMVSKKYEMFNMLNIPIYGKTLYDSLHKYFEKEKLESKYYDEKAKKHINSYRQIRLIKVPKYLIIVLKRYKNDDYGIIKSDNSISFPIENLDMSHFSEGYDSIDCSLKLICIGCHVGSLNGGHYYSICRYNNKNWFKYDDDIVTEYSLLNNKFEIFKTGYILIYEKINY